MNSQASTVSRNPAGAPPAAHSGHQAAAASGNHCGHQQRASIRYLHGNDWVSLCLDCWRRQRSNVVSRGLQPISRPAGAVATYPEAGYGVAGWQDGWTTERGFSRGVPHPRPRRVMLYSHDTFGLGHLRRNLAIARQLLAMPGRFEVLLLTGSPMQDSWPLPPGLTVRALPPVVKLGDEHYGPRDHAKNFALLKGHREALILEAALSFRPDVFLVDHAPIGMGGELLPTLALLQEDYPDTRLVLGMRDIIDAPAATRQVWQEQGIHDILERVYDRVLVYGREDWFDVVASYEIPEPVARKIRYCGYVCNDPSPESVAPALPPVLPGRQRVLITVGGGGDGARIIEAYLQALREHGGFGCQSLIVPGPLMDPTERARLEAMAAECQDTHFIDGATDMLPLMGECSLVIAMAGYNTSSEILSLGCKAILVPRARPRAEQRLRSEMLARFGLVDRVDPDGDLVEQLGRLVPHALDIGDRHRTPFPLEGAARVAEELLALCPRSEAMLEA